MLACCWQNSPGLLPILEDLLRCLHCAGNAISGSAQDLTWLVQAAAGSAGLSENQPNIITRLLAVPYSIYCAKDRDKLRLAAPAYM
jgi:hypothetical protein